MKNEGPRQTTSESSFISFSSSETVTSEVKTQIHRLISQAEQLIYSPTSNAVEILDQESKIKKIEQALKRILKAIETEPEIQTKDNTIDKIKRALELIANSNETSFHRLDPGKSDVANTLMYSKKYPSK